MINSSINIIALGDSITYGYPYTPNSSWVHLAAEQLGLTIINKGINGDTTAGMLSRFDKAVVKHKPSHVIIMGGTNDAFARLDAEEVTNNITLMVELSVKNGIVSVVGLPIPCVLPGDECILGLYREEMRHYSMDNRIVVIDFCKAFLKPQGRGIKLELYADAVHPNEKGYEAMAGVAIEVVGSFISHA